MIVYLLMCVLIVLGAVALGIAPTLIYLWLTRSGR